LSGSLKINELRGTFRVTHFSFAHNSQTLWLKWKIFIKNRTIYLHTF